MARWTPLASHLLQRIYGTLVAAAPDTEAAMAVVEESVEAADEHTTCIMCHVMIAVPAAIAYAEGGRLDEARVWLAEAEVSAALWQGTAWQGAVREARDFVIRTEAGVSDYFACGRIDGFTRSTNLGDCEAGILGFSFEVPNLSLSIGCLAENKRARDV